MQVRHQRVAMQSQLHEIGRNFENAETCTL